MKYHLPTGIQNILVEKKRRISELETEVKGLLEVNAALTEEVKGLKEIIAKKETEQTEKKVEKKKKK